MPARSTTPPAYHAESETSPLLAEKPLESGEVQATNQAGNPRRRFWRALSIATVLYVLMEVVAIACVVKFYLAYRPFSAKPTMADPDRDSDNYNCAVNWSDRDTSRSTPHPGVNGADFLSELWPGEYSAFTSFDLPTDAPLLYFLSRGHLIAGSISYDTSSRLRDKVQVDIEMRYRTQEGRDRTEVCLLYKNDGSAGVGIYGHGDLNDTPRHDLFVKFHVTVKFPGSIAHPLQLKDLEADTALFAHRFGDLEKSVSFESVSVSTSNTPIEVNSLYAKYVTLSDQNTPISGRFNVSDSLVLSTSNAKIDVEAALSNKGDDPTELRMSTSNSEIRSKINLYSLKGDGKEGGSYNVHASTSNAPVVLGVPVAPRKPRLDLTASTSSSRAEVRLPLEYEGTIDASTSWAGIILSVDTDAKDPSGNNLKRNVKVTRSTGSSVFASTWWGDDEKRKELGSVKVSTSFGKCTIEA